ncbi:MAG: MBL fold metallo-hydrolase [Myxococcota bacterium]
MNRRLLVGVVGFIVVLAMLPVGVFGIGLMVARSGNLPVEPGSTLAEGRVTLISESLTNAFVIRIDDGVVLIDAGVSPEGMVEALAAVDVDPQDVRAVFLTHGQYDHVGGLDAFPGALIYAAEAEIPLLTGRAIPQSPAGQFIGPNDAHVSLQQALHDGDEVMVGDLKVTAYLLPGYTMGSMAYLAAGVLFLGDNAGAAADGSIKQAPWVFTADRAQNHASLVALRDRLPAQRVTGLAFGRTGSLSSVEPFLAYGR